MDTRATELIEFLKTVRFRAEKNGIYGNKQRIALLTDILTPERTLEITLYVNGERFNIWDSPEFVGITSVILVDVYRNEEVDTAKSLRFHNFDPNAWYQLKIVKE